MNITMNRRARRLTVYATGILVFVSLGLLGFGLSMGNPSIAAPAAPDAGVLKVMRMGLGSGTITSSDGRINCGTDCDEPYASTASVTLTVSADAGSTFAGWDGDCSGASTCLVTMSASRSVRASFSLTPAIPPILAPDIDTDLNRITVFASTAISTYLSLNSTVTSTARFIAALPRDFKQNWILMSRSESLQTGTAPFPRILLPSADAKYVFTVGMAVHSAYPGSHPNAIEYMQWDAAQKNFRFHEIVLADIPEMGTITVLNPDGTTTIRPSIPARSRGVSIDDAKCSKCHSTRNVYNPSPTSHGTTGIPPGTVQFKNKPNWDAYDSWGGMLPFNRDRIYQGSVEAAAFRRIFNPWTWEPNPSVRAIIEQLELQPPGVPAAHVITRTNGGANDGHVNFASPFDTFTPMLIEPIPSGTDPTITTNYAFNGAPGIGTRTPVTRGGTFITLHHSANPTSGEGRGVQLFDLLGGGDGDLNAQRIADELINHRFATGSVPIEVRPIALAITKQCLNITGNTVVSTAPSTSLMIPLDFFDARHGGIGIAELEADTRIRAQSLTQRKADIQRFNLDRLDDPSDPYLFSSAPANGLIQQYGFATSVGTNTSLRMIDVSRQEVFRRPIDLGAPDATVMERIYVDREDYAFNTERVALFRYFLEPLGVSVDKWSMGVRGRSRTYTFADVFDNYIPVLQSELELSLTNDPRGLTLPTYACDDLIGAVNSTLSALSLPAANDVPKYTDVQRIFNKGCIECHGGLGYPPYSVDGTLDLSENESAPEGVSRLIRSHQIAAMRALTLTSPLYARIKQTTEECPYGLMPCGGPRLSQADIETIRRWIVGRSLYSEGDPHIKTIDGVGYDFQSAGEFVLLRDENLEIQTRQTAVKTVGPLDPNLHTGLRSCASINTAVALRVGAHRITYQPNLNGQPDPSGLQLRIDGQLTTMDGQELLLPAGGRIVRTTAPGGLQIEYPGGTVVAITPQWWDHFQVWFLNINARQVRATDGVMGAIAPGNWLPALPDGSLLGPRPVDLRLRYQEIYETFADAWRVSQATALFDYAAGTSTETFTIDGWPKEFLEDQSVWSCSGLPGNTPPLHPLPWEEAAELCSAIVSEERRANCVQDVRVTGEPGFAQSYLLTEEIEHNTMPTAPAPVFPENNATVLTTTVSFHWNTAVDLDGDSLTYRLCIWGVDESYTFEDCRVVSGETLSLDVALESGKAYFWKIVTEDGKGGSTESETRHITTPPVEVVQHHIFLPVIIR